MRMNARLSLLACAMALAASADTLYVSSASGVGAYDTTTGAAINATLIGPTLIGSPSVVSAAEIAVAGNALFASAGTSTIVCDPRGGCSVRTTGAAINAYNATTGALNTAGFISGLNALPVVAVANDTVFVSNPQTNTRSGFVATYNASTGAVINTNFITETGFVSRLLVSGPTLFVNNFIIDQRLTHAAVSEYNAATGVLINPSFIVSGHDQSAPPYGFSGIALSGNILYVAAPGNPVTFPGTPGNGIVAEYNATTGAVINPHFITGLNVPEALALVGNTLFVASLGNTYPNVVPGTGVVGAYDATTGAAINANFISGLTYASDLAVSPSAPVPEPSTASLVIASGVALLGLVLSKKITAGV